MKLSKKAKKHVETANKAFEGAKASMKIYEKRFSKVLGKCETNASDDRMPYIQDVRRITKYVNEGNTLISSLQMYFKDVKTTSKRFKYMSFNETCQLGLKPDDIKNIRQRLNKIADAYPKMITEVHKIQFDMIRETLTRINDNIMVSLDSDFYECKIRMFRTPLVDIDWYLNGNFICSTEERPYYKSLSADPVKEPLTKPLPALDRDISKKLDTLAMENCRSKEPKSFVDALVDCGVIPSDVPGEITGAPKTEEIKADTEALKQAADKKSFSITDDKKE